jgi:peroxiredoxin Q/BCP
MARPPTPPYKSGMLAAGAAAPDFTVPDETGAQRRLGDFRGRTLVLWFYPKADTPG